jgi:hypothetical protein
VTVVVVQVPEVALSICAVSALFIHCLLSRNLPSGTSASRLVCKFPGHYSRFINITAHESLDIGLVNVLRRSYGNWIKHQSFCKLITLTPVLV